MGPQDDEASGADESSSIATGRIRRAIESTGGQIAVLNTNHYGVVATSHSSSDERHEADGLFRSSLSQETSTTEAGVDEWRAKASYHNFCLMALLFSAVPASALACLSLATARLGELGAWQDGTLYLSYTLSSVTFAIVLVKQLGSRSALVLGMALYCCYVGFFFLANAFREQSSLLAKVFALTGAAVGGLGAGILWTSQGTFFAEAAQDYARFSGMDLAAATAHLGGLFAFVLLFEETSLGLFSTLLVRAFKVPWALVFSIYFFIAVAATSLMVFVKENSCSSSSSANKQQQDGENGDRQNNSSSALDNAASTVRLLVNDSKMKYMIGLNASFGFAGAFLDTFVNGEVVPMALNDEKASFVPLLVAIHGGAAAVASLGFGHVSQRIGKGPILYLGAVCFAWVAIPFLIQPDIERWTFVKLLGVYCVEGIGRATFEGTLKAVFADYFSYEKEAAYANIILQYGISGAVAYTLSTRLKCHGVSTYCVEYRDGSGVHNVGTFAMCVVLASFLGVLGFARASCLQRSQRRMYDELGPAAERHVV